ncbi:MAG: hypothetical protein EOQ29_21400 [Mesorhizobium sp.]|nr:MAG: hypothetical protein EOQ29_21400 [Mesorhizobium sp.]
MLTRSVAGKAAVKQIRRATLIEYESSRSLRQTDNEAYVKARYSRHYEIGEEALVWLGQRTEQLQTCAAEICREHLVRMREARE